MPLLHPIPDEAFDFLWVIRSAMDELDNETAQQRLNILVCGKSGVGKSTLINAVFGAEVAKTGSGKPVTQEIEEFRLPHHPLSLFDTRGFELEAFDEILAKIESFVRTRNDSLDPNDHIHLIWYCVSEGSQRIEEGELNFIRTMGSEHQIATILVMTQAVEAEDSPFYRALHEQLQTFRASVPLVAVNALPRQSKRITIEAFGIDELIRLSYERLPEQQAIAFARAQKKERALKKVAAEAVVRRYALLAASAAATPIPFSDAIALIPLQIKMVVDLNRLYQIDVQAEWVKATIGAAIGPIAATLAGRALAGSLLKLIPGIGSLVGGTINAAIAAGLTYALGTAYHTVLSESDTFEPTAIGGKLAEVLRRIDLKEAITRVSQWLPKK